MDGCMRGDIDGDMRWKYERDGDVGDSKGGKNGDGKGKWKL